MPSPSKMNGVSSGTLALPTAGSSQFKVKEENSPVKKLKREHSPAKDPNSPKRARSAYSFFVADKMRGADQKEVGHADTMRRIGQEWSQVRSRPRDQAEGRSQAEPPPAQLGQKSKITDFFKKLA